MAVEISGDTMYFNAISREGESSTRGSSSVAKPE